MEEEVFSWPLLGVANGDSLIQSFQVMAYMPQTAANADIIATSRQGRTDFYATIYQCDSCQTNDLQCLIDRV
jgi:hypothetical protein